MFGYNQVLESTLITLIIGKSDLTSFISKGGIQIGKKSGSAFKRGR